jgi:hypothetical protein
MFLLTVFGMTKPYSTKQLAEKNAAKFVRQVRCSKMFENAFQQEHYEVCCNIWNDYVLVKMYGDSLHMINITEVSIDTPFT